jgi:hypothetical protein
LKVATNRQPVAVFYPPTEQYVIVSRGDEFPDDHAIVKDKTNSWLFEEDKGEGMRVYGEPSEPVEQATRGPGERRSTRRKPAEKSESEPVDPGSGNGPIRSDSR